MAAAKKAASAPSQPTKAAACAVPDCPREPARSGLCGGHYDTHRGLRVREG